METTPENQDNQIVIISDILVKPANGSELNQASPVLEPLLSPTISTQTELKLTAFTPRKKKLKRRIKKLRNVNSHLKKKRIPNG